MSDDAAAEVITEPTLAELAETANREQEAGFRDAASALSHFVGCGEALLEAKRRKAATVSDGEAAGWRVWLEENFEGHFGTAGVWMRLAYYRQALEHEGITQVNTARLYLAGLPEVSEGGRPNQRYGDEVRDEARRLRGQGLSYAEIGRMLSGIHRGQVRRMIDPDYAERQRQAVRKGYARRRQAAPRNLQAEREAAVRKVGGSVAKSYSMIRKTLQALDRAHGEAEDREVRAALSAATAKLHNAEDEIVRALGVS